MRYGRPVAVILVVLLLTHTAWRFALNRRVGSDLIAAGRTATEFVDALRTGGHSRVSLVVKVGGRVVGHVLFSDLPILTDGGTVAALSLAPMAVLPEFQRKGIGSALVQAGLIVVVVQVLAGGFVNLSVHRMVAAEIGGNPMGAGEASSFAMAALVNSVFTLISGQLIDRFSGLALLPFVLVPLGLACLILGLFEAQWTPFLFMAFLGFSNGLSTTLFGAVWPEIYGLKHLGAIRALAFSAMVSLPPPDRG